MGEAYKNKGYYDEAVAKGLLSLQADHVENPNRIRGHANKLYKRRARLNVRQKFFTHRVVDLWNHLPSTVIEAPSVKAFERRLDKCWSNQDMLYNFKAVWKKCCPVPTGGEDEFNSEEDLDK